jgi:hypothetical protein
MVRLGLRLAWPPPCSFILLTLPLLRRMSAPGNIRFE